ncbi:LysR family transcriptional regulator [Dongia deserti]|uniref:LysR family transcriptional regulator n=1 Tax=Dongia deserti TaxID=2268030 RepID=UPI000E65DCB7|nr:LysR family transcriptional regulator [Dongia deserti]
MSFNIRQIRYFVAAAEAGKIITAASAVGISPSAITEAIQDLEESVGTRLVTRHRGGIKVTYDGYVFLQHCRNVLSALTAATFAVGAHRKRVEGELTIGVTITVAGYFLAAPLARFRRSFPDVTVSIRELDRSVIERQLVNGQLGLGILLVSNLKHVQELATETLAKSRRRLWTSTNHLLLAKPKVTLRDIAKEPYIQLTIDEAAKTTLSYWSKHNLAPKVVFRTDSVEAVRSLVATGAGVTILSDMVYRPWSLEGDKLESREVSAQIPTMDVGLAWSKSAELPAPARAFIEFCRMEFLSGNPRSMTL